MITFIDDPKQFRAPVSDVYYHPAYGTSAALIDGGRWESAVDTATGLSFSYIRRDIQQSPGHYDTITPYGYGGISHPEGSEASQACVFRSDYLLAARDRGLVAEFARINPLDSSTSFVSSARDVGERTTFGSYIEDADQEFLRVSGKHRTAVRKSQALGVNVFAAPIANTLESSSPFRTLYDHAMRRLKARDSLRLGDEYFALLCELPEDAATLVLARHDNEIVAAAIFLIWGRRVHYHLSATSQQGRMVHATNAIIEFAKRRLVEPPFYLHLGGGLAEDDSLSKFKQSCSSERLTMHMIEQVVDGPVFDELSRGFVQTRFFPPYRDPSQLDVH